MSHFTQMKTRITDHSCLIRALRDLGFHAVEAHASPMPLYGWKGDRRSESAEVIVRRELISRVSNDIGFRRSADGSFEAIISEFDRDELKYDADWIARLVQHYAYHATRKAYLEQGFEIVAEDREDDAMRLVLRRLVLTPEGVEDQRIESSVASSGDVSIKVDGVKGGRCTEVTKSVEAALGGRMEERIFTGEYLQPSPFAPQPESVPIPIRRRPGGRYDD
jgi:hypothetical protein